jgi:putative transposase
MARLPRFFAPEIPLHIILRGNDRKAIVGNGEDLLFLRTTLTDAAAKHDLRVHTYVIMTNHLHLLATPAKPDSAPKTLQRFRRIYVQYFNRRYRRTGTLWEGRYRATAVEAEAYLIHLMRYIELNPVRAGMVTRADDYAWSSFRANALGVADALVMPHSVYLSIDGDAERRRVAYSELFDAAHTEHELTAIRHSVNKGWALGGEGFLQQLERLSTRRVVAQSAGRPKKIEDLIRV